MKLPSSVVSRDRDTDMNSTMTPMIDVVFLLLIFFVWTASFQVIEHVMKSEMSAEVGSAERLRLTILLVESPDNNRN